VRKTSHINFAAKNNELKKNGEINENIKVIKGSNAPNINSA